ncbi:MAG TPA: hypothetical protein VF484_10580, partial [Candidatus Limnocylindrales bacterium]
GGRSDVIGPPVNVVHRLLKNTVREQIGNRPYVLLTEPAASRLGVGEVGVPHQESYADVGDIESRVVDLGELARPEGLEPPTL